MKILKIIYKRLSKDQIRNEIHNSLYGPNSSKNELTKLIIDICNKIMANKYKHHDLLLNTLPPNSQENKDQIINEKYNKNNNSNLIKFYS